MAFIQSEEALTYLRNMAKKRGRPFKEVVPSAGTKAISLLERMLIFNPDKRISAADSLRHPFLSHLYDEADEADYRGGTSEPDWEFDAHDVKEPELRRLFWDEILKYHPDQK
eukprot:NODE_2333_length_488_cov_64.361644_g2316_i0.p1 GENE.NODE_2333_length_488_cov_64.361644_g2316_i0~~NODE_2333_length_488_cov_64.361644_g2316_i0.p1  ORF type:complete len:126 (+),score=30.98 NODE_2333_length_488_cov_64.361644_g2316_i0:44-379(+)